MIPIHQVSRVRRVVVRHNNVKNLSSNSILVATTNTKNTTTSLRKRLFVSSSSSRKNYHQHVQSISNKSTVRRGIISTRNCNYSSTTIGGANNNVFESGHNFLLTSAVLTGILGAAAAHNVHKNNVVSCEQSNENESLDMKTLEKEWEDFMQKAMNPEEDDDDDDDDDDEEDEDEGDDEDDEDEEQENEEKQEQNNGEANKVDEDNDVGQEEEGEEGVSSTSSSDESNDEATKSEPQPPLISNETIDQKIVVEDKEMKLDNAVDESEFESEENQTSSPPTTTTSSSSSQEESKEDQKQDPYDNLPEEDEPTTCTICLINRQGPCRPLWRKFERCMKDHGGEEDDENNDNSKKSSLGEMCDQYMMPWIGCIQGYKNTYTLIANEFFQKELVDEIESTIADDEKVLLDNIDISSIVQMSDEWWNRGMDGSSSESNNEEEGKGSEDVSSGDVVLVEGMAKINLFDGDKPVQIAYVKDQDGKMLGYDQFTEFKKELESDDKESDKSTTTTPTIGQCAFHISPEKTKSIQIYALYRSKEVEEEEDDHNQKGNENADDAKSVEQTLYYSSAVLIDDIENPSKKKEVAE